MVKKVTAAGSDASAPQQYYAPYLSGADLTELLRGQAMIAQGQSIMACALAGLKAAPVSLPVLAEEQSFFDTGFVATAGAMLTAAPAAAASTEGKKKRKRRAGPKRLSAYTLFFGDRMKAVDRSGRAFRDVTGAIGAEWRGLTAEEKQPFVDRAEMLNTASRLTYNAEHGITEEGEQAASAEAAASSDEESGDESSSSSGESSSDDEESSNDSDAENATPMKPVVAVAAPTPATVSPPTTTVQHKSKKSKVSAPVVAVPAPKVVEKKKAHHHHQHKKDKSSVKA